MLKKTIEIFLALALLILPATAFAQAEQETEIIAEKGIILEIETTTKRTEDSDIFFQPVGEELPEYMEVQELKVKILSGEDKNKIVKIENDLKGNPLDIKVKKGDKVFLYAQVYPGEPTIYFIQDFWHLDGLILWAIIFVILVLILGGKQGLKALVSLGVSLFLIFGVLIPLINAGFNPLLMTFLVATAVTIIAILILAGFSKKALTAILGTIGGVLTAIIFVQIVGEATHLTGLGTEDTRMLAVNFPDFNFQGLLFAGIVIGALGAVMDVAISISSGLEEVRQHKPHITSKELVKSGLNIGRDIMGSMLNTLIFAYVGASLAVILLLSGFETNLIELLNYDFISEEIVRSLIGSLGLIATIPLTALSAGILCKDKS